MFLMAYSPDLRKRILDFIESGGKKSETFGLFTVARPTQVGIYASEVNIVLIRCQN